MADSHVHLAGSIFGTVLTLILGRITQLTANDVSAFATIFAGTATGIFSTMKAIDWWEKRQTRRRYEKKHKTPQ